MASFAGGERCQRLRREQDDVSGPRTHESLRPERPHDFCEWLVDKKREADPQLPIRVRVGMHTGQAIRDDAGYYGRTVIAAFRVSSLAQADEILISDDTRRKLPKGMFALGRSRDVRLKGFERRCRVWQVRWRDARDVNRSQVWSSGRVLRIARAGSAEVSGAAGR